MKLSATILALTFGITAIGNDTCAMGTARETNIVGKYKLYIGTNQNTSNDDFSSSTLTILNDGTFTQECSYKGGPTKRTKGNWTLKNRNILFSSFFDCAGVWPDKIRNGNMGASLIIEGGKSPIILLSPDMNVFYEKIH